MKELLCAFAMELSVLRGALFIADMHPHNVGLGFVFLISLSVFGLTAIREHFSQINYYS
jgi:hypothetical protein